MSQAETLNRRDFLRLLGVGLVLVHTSFQPPAALGAAFVQNVSGDAAKRGGAALPILMFHKVDDAPRFPEDISSGQLAALFASLWAQGFYPVNMSDVLDGKVDSVVPKGLKPVGITADDAHRSVLFSRENMPEAGLANARSLLDILRDSLAGLGIAPRATLFVSEVGDVRVSRKPGGYFGNLVPLTEALASLAGMPQVEIGCHTRRHLRMDQMSVHEVERAVLDQKGLFEDLGLSRRLAPILAYPYGVRPSAKGLECLRGLGLKGAVLAFPGVGEASYSSIPSCEYDGKLVTDPFLIPRVCIGSHLYAPKSTGGGYTAIDPLEDFRKDVLLKGGSAPDAGQNRPTSDYTELYVSRGA